MTWREFIVRAVQEDVWPARSVLALKLSEPAPLFCSKLFDRFVESGILEDRPQLLPFASLASDHTKSGILVQHFLGEEKSFNLGMLPGRIDKKGLATLHYITRYAGPHRVCLLYDESLTLPKKELRHLTGLHTLEVPGEVDRRSVESLLHFFGHKIGPKENFLLDAAFSLTSTLALDAACMLLDYFAVISRYTARGFVANLPRMLEPKLSLHSLSRHFFARDAQAFWKQWMQMRTDYADMFWVTFFSEQLWQAHHVILYAKAGKSMLAKKVGYRLPYTYINGGFRSYDAQALSLGYAKLYHLDFALKNGSIFPGLEVFFAEHFSQAH